MIVLVRMSESSTVYTDVSDEAIDDDILILTPDSADLTVDSESVRDLHCVYRRR